jgi:hypothetical protein
MFDPGRFCRLAAATWIENRRAWAWFLAIVVMLHFVVVLVVLAGRSGHAAFTVEGQSAFYFTGLFVTAPIFASRYFAALQRPGSALVALMRPVSTLETWLLALLVVGVAYPLAYHLVFYVCDVPATLLAHAQAKAAAARLDELQQVGFFGLHREYQARDYAIFWPDPRGGHALELFGIAQMLWTVQGFALLGSLVFRNSPALKTLLVAFLVLLATLALDAVLGLSSSNTLFGFWDDFDGLTRAQFVVYALAWFGIPALLWAGAYVGLREREVA